MIVLESGFYPYVLISFRGKDFSEAEFTAHLDASAAVGRKAQEAGTRHAVITLGGADMRASKRKMVAELMEDFPKELMDLPVGSYVVVNSAVVRGIVTVLRWLSPRLSRIEAVESIDDAMVAASAAFRANGIVVEAATTSSARRWLEDELALREQLTA